jgi:hypothetical protein
MIQTLTHAGRWARLRAPLLAFVVLAAGCDSADNLATTDPTVPIEGATLDSAAADSSVVSDSALTDSLATDSLLNDSTLTPAEYAEIEASEAAIRRRGIAFGPFGLWKSAKIADTGPFTGSHNYTDASSIIMQINNARSKNHRLVLAMTGGPSSRYTTRGRFDWSKWKRKMDTFNSSAIRRAVAAGVMDGTIVGNALIDEPETAQWGPGMTKAVIDKMATYAKALFPTLPMGVNQGPPAYRWRSSERYRKVDYVVNQYAWWVTSGNVERWRQEVLAQARRDGVTPAFSLNILNGGVQDRKGWDCRGTGGKGIRYPNCRLSSEQVRTWAKTLGASGCVMVMWKYDRAFMSKASNVAAMRDVASTLASKSGRSCRRGNG